MLYYLTLYCIQLAPSSMFINLWLKNTNYLFYHTFWSKANLISLKIIFHLIYLILFWTFVSAGSQNVTQTLSSNKNMILNHIAKFSFKLRSSVVDMIGQMSSKKNSLQVYILPFLLHFFCSQSLAASKSCTILTTYPISHP